MNIAVGTAFRNAPQRQVMRFFEQVKSFDLFSYPLDKVHVIVAEGDSKDDTRARIIHTALEKQVPIDLVSCDHGGPVFGSTEDPKRMEALSSVGNAILGGVGPTDDILVYVESDLIWDALTISQLVERLILSGYDVLCPMVFAGKNFYDIWAFRKNGIRFGPFPPYHPELDPEAITEVDSAGSCLIMKAEVARQVRMTDGALVEWGNNARLRGFRIAVDPRLKVRHP